MAELLTVPYEGVEGFGSKAYSGDAGIDLPVVGEHLLSPGERKDIPSGVKVAIPEGYYGRITGRSSSVRKRNVLVFEGIIDSGFRGELFSFVENVGHVATVIKEGDRVAQLIIAPVVETHFTNGRALPESDRGEKGFGSSDYHLRDRAAIANREDHRLATVDLDRIANTGTVYLGGPIDGAKTDPDLWRDEAVKTLARWGWNWFDPHIENRGDPDPVSVFKRNLDAITACDVALFYFADPPCYGFGSPIEIDYAMGQDKRVIIVHEGGHEPGVYLRYYWQQGAAIFETLAQALTDITSGTPA